MLKGNYWILSFGLMASCQKVPKFDFQSQFSKSKIIWIFLNCFFIEKYQFRGPIFDTSPLTQFSKFNNFLWVCWFLGKNLSNFVPPVWKLHNPYCHTLQSFQSLLDKLCSAKHKKYQKIRNFSHKRSTKYAVQTASSQEPKVEILEMYKRSGNARIIL